METVYDKKDDNVSEINPNLLNGNEVDVKQNVKALSGNDVEVDQDVKFGRTFVFLCSCLNWVL
jgi:hypothetical protein